MGSSLEVITWSIVSAFDCDIGAEVGNSKMQTRAQSNHRSCALGPQRRAEATRNGGKWKIKNDDGVSPGTCASRPPLLFYFWLPFLFFVWTESVGFNDWTSDSGSNLLYCSNQTIPLPLFLFFATSNPPVQAPTQAQAILCATRITRHNFSCESERRPNFKDSWK